MNILRELLKWAESRPNWQRDALRRLWVNADFTSTDRSEALTLLKKEHGLIDPTNGQFRADPITENHISAPRDSSPPTVILSLHNLHNVK